MGRVRVVDTSDYEKNFRASRTLRVVDTLEHAKDVRRTFTKKEPRELREQPWTWPTTYTHVGDSLAVAYASDKWKKNGDMELYKHLAESRNYAFAAPGVDFVPLESPHTKYPVVTQLVSFEDRVMPKHIAFLGMFEEIHLQFYRPGAVPSRKLRGDEGVARVLIKHAFLGGGLMDGDRPFLVVYSEPRGNDPGGVHMIITGDELDIEADGIVG